MAERKYFGKLGDVIEPPPFIEAQIESLMSQKVILARLPEFS